MGYPHLAWKAAFVGVSCLLVASAVGCSGSLEEDGGDEGIEEAALSSLSVKLAEEGDDVSVVDSPRLKSRARGSLVCKKRFELDGRVRLSCGRRTEFLEVIVRPADHEALLVHRAAGRSSDRRNFYACTPEGQGPGGLPAKLACRSAPLRDRSGGGGLTSPFDSTVPGIGVPNTHLVGASGMLLRGMAPRSEADFDQLLGAGVAAVMVFKNQTGNGHDVADEITELQTRGLAASRVKNIPFKWKEMGTFQESCEQTLDALRFIKTNLAADKKTFFHCTVGEDRTGYLAAVHRLLFEEGLEAGQAWDGEMCERGYGAGNPLKPSFVVGTLEGSIEPLYRKMAWLVAKGKLTKSLRSSACATDPETDATFETTALPKDRLDCGTSTRFVP